MTQPNGTHQAARPTACLAIPTYGREDVLVRTLEQVFRLEPRFDEVLVIDQTVEHEPETESFLRKAHDGGDIRWVRQSPPNLPKARNRALAETRSEIIFFLDDDVELPTGYVDSHLRNFADPRITAVAGRVKEKDEKRFPPKGDYRSWPRELDFLYFGMNRTDRVEGIAYLPGGNHSVRVEAIKRVGGYDENFIGNGLGEDIDAAFRLWKSGGVIVYDPEAWMFHLAAPTGGCRIKDPRKPTPEWAISFPLNYLIFRHLFPSRTFWKLAFLMYFRRFALRKDNVLKPWRMPWALLSYAYSLSRAGWYAYRKTREGSGPKV